MFTHATGFWLVGVAALVAVRAGPAQTERASSAESVRSVLLATARQRIEAMDRERAALDSPERIAEYQRRIRGRYLEAMGPFPQRTPLNAETVGTVERDGYRVEKILFESRPHHHVASLLFLPAGASAAEPVPGVIVACGHALEAKTYHEYQRMGALLALAGLGALVFDPIDQGERIQSLDGTGHQMWWGTTGHLMAGIKAVLLGANTAGFEVWDGMRALDYLESRPEVSGPPFGCLGNSGGGTQASLMLVCDERIGAAAPSCYITSFERLLQTIGPQDAEQIIFGQLDFGFDHAEFLVARAPTPTLVCAATNDFFSIAGTRETVERARPVFARLGAPSQIELIEAEGPHAWHQPLRERSVEWMVRHLAGRDIEFDEPQIELLTSEQCRVTPDGQVMLLAGERSVHDLLAEQAERAAQVRGALGLAERLAGAARLTAIGPVLAGDEARVRVEESRTINGVLVERVRLSMPDGVWLSGVRFQAAGGRGDTGVSTLLVRDEGIAGLAPGDEPVRSVLARGGSVLAVDVRGIGAGAPENEQWYGRFGREGRDAATAYLLGQPWVSLQAQDLIACAGALGDEVVLMAHGRIGIAAWHAAALVPGVFEGIEVTGCIGSWEEVIRNPGPDAYFGAVVPGALWWYDLPDLVEACARAQQLP